MKKIIIIIGLALVAGITSTIHAQSSVTVQTESVTVTTTLPVGVGAALISQAVIKQGQIRIVGTNAVISGVATITIPASQLGQLVTSLPTGYDITNLASSSFTTGAEGVTVRAVLSKSVDSGSVTNFHQ